MPNEQDVYLFREGTHAHVDRLLGCHFLGNESGAEFAVWAPNAASVSVIGDWNGWQAGANPLALRTDGSGIWEGTIAAAQHGQSYKYRIVAREGYALEKADPVGFCSELPPATASRIWALNYEWGDDNWMATRAGRNGLDAPMSI